VPGLRAGQGGGESTKIWMSVLTSLRSGCPWDLYFAVCGLRPGHPRAYRAGLGNSSTAEAVFRGLKRQVAPRGLRVLAGHCACATTQTCGPPAGPRDSPSQARRTPGVWPARTGERGRRPNDELAALYRAGSPRTGLDIQYEYQSPSIANRVSLDNR